MSRENIKSTEIGENAFLMIVILAIPVLIIFGFSSIMGKISAEDANVDIIDSTAKYKSNGISVEMLDYLFEQANSLLTQPPTSVMDKTQSPPSGDRHDFLDLAPYCWPNSTSPNGLPYICDDSRGTNPEFYTIPDYENMLDMIRHVKILSLAYHFSENDTYASKATELLRVWFLNEDTKMNPNLQYSELVRGKNSGTPHGIIGGKDFPEIFESIRFMEKSSSWTSRDEQGMKVWFTKYFDWLTNSTNGIKEGKSKNNHGTWYNVQSSGIALFLNRNEIIERILHKSMDSLIEIQILPDGRQPLELKRPIGLTYSLFNLHGLFKLANIGDEVGIDLWNYETHEGAGLQKALDYLIPYVFNQSSWPYKQDGPIDMYTVAKLLHEATIHYPDDELHKQAYRLMDQKYIIADTDNLANIVLRR